MNTVEMTNWLQEDPEVSPMFRGVLPIDKVPEMFDAGVYVINTSPSHVRKGHWVAVVNGEFFCSYGINPVMYGLPNMPYSHKMLQALTSDVCGLYVLLYIKVRCRGFGLDDFLECFTDNPVLNDTIIQNCASCLIIY